jgi:hypothetical protein
MFYKIAFCVLSLSTLGASAPAMYFNINDYDTNSGEKACSRVTTERPRAGFSTIYTPESVSGHRCGSFNGKLCCRTQLGWMPMYTKQFSLTPPPPDWFRTDEVRRNARRDMTETGDPPCPNIFPTAAPTKSPSASTTNAPSTSTSTPTTTTTTGPTGPTGTVAPTGPVTTPPTEGPEGPEEPQPLLPISTAYTFVNVNGEVVLVMSALAFACTVATLVWVDRYWPTSNHAPGPETKRFLL